MILLVTYDLKKPGQNYQQLYDAIKLLGVWWHNMDSTWLVDTGFTPEQAQVKLLPKIDKNDALLVIRVTNQKAGWLIPEAWNWFNGRIF